MDGLKTMTFGPKSGALETASSAATAGVAPGQASASAAHAITTIRRWILIPHLLQPEK